MKDNSILIQNKVDDSRKFKFTLPILKTRVNITKNDKGEEIEERFISGVASNTEEDLVGDIMAPSAIKSMADSIHEHLIKLNAEHDTSWRSEIGDVVKLDVDKKNNLEFEGKLNKMSVAEDLWKALTEDNKKLGVSIGGYIREYELEKGTSGEWVRVFKDIQLDHLAITSSPANPKTWVNAIAKSLDKKTQETLNNIEEEVKEGQLDDKEVIKKVESMLKEINKEDLSEDVIKLIFKNTDDMRNKKTSLEAEKLDKSQVDENVEEEAVEAEAEAENSATPEDGDTAEPKEPADSAEAVEAVEEEEAEDDSAEASEETDEAEESEEADNSEEAEADDEEETTEKTLGSSYSLIDAAAQLNWAIRVLKDNDKDTGTLESALETIKQAAADELSEPEEKSVKEATEADSIEKTEETESEEAVVEKSTEEDDDEGMEEAVEMLTKAITERLEAKYQADIDVLKTQLEELQNQPADRKGVDVSKGFGSENDGDSVETSKEELIKSRDSEIEEIRKNNTINADTKFAQIQAVRGRYKQEYGI